MTCGSVTQSVWISFLLHAIATISGNKIYYPITLNFSSAKKKTVTSIWIKGVRARSFSSLGRALVASNVIAFVAAGAFVHACVATSRAHAMRLGRRSARARERARFMARHCAEHRVQTATVRAWHTSVPQKFDYQSERTLGDTYMLISVFFGNALSIRL